VARLLSLAPVTQPSLSRETPVKLPSALRPPLTRGVPLSFGPVKDGPSTTLGLMATATVAAHVPTVTFRLQYTHNLVKCYFALFNRRVLNKMELTWANSL
jgi:hypothetical protein